MPCQCCTSLINGADSERLCSLFDLGCNHFAWAAPCCVEVDHDVFVVFNDLVEGIVTRRETTLVIFGAKPKA
jgi:hypothetical protein